MTLKTDIDQLAADAVLMHQVMHGNATTTVTTAGGPVRSVARLIADKDAEINVSAGGILAQSVAQVGFATAQAVAAGNALSQANIAVAQALSAAGTAGQYSTALAAIASQTAIVPAATVTGFNGAVVASCIHDARTNSDGGARRRACQHTTWYKEATTATGKHLGKLASLAAAWAVSGAAVGDHYYDQTTKLFYSIGGTAGAPTRAEIVAGSRAEMPEVLGVTVEVGRVVLWDLTDSTQPMWRVFKSTAYNAAGCGVLSYLPNLSSCSMAEGVLAIGNNYSVGGFSGSLVVIDFFADTAKCYSTVGSSVGFTGIWTTGLGNRHVLGSYNGAPLPAPVNQIVNSVIVTIVPNAPINPTTGLPTPTVIIGTTGGVSIFKDDGTVSNRAFVWAYNYDSIAVSGEVLYFGNAAAAFGYFIQSLRDLTAATFTGTQVGSTVLSKRYGYMQPSKESLIYAKSTHKTGIYLHKENLSSLNAGMVADVTTTIPGCWQVGDSRGAWLADTVVETVSGTPVIASTFTGTSNLDGWVLEPTATNNAGVNMLDVTSGTATNLLATRVISGLIVGKSYVINFTRVGGYFCSLGVFGLGVAAYSATAGIASYQFTALATSHTAALYSTSSVQRAQFGSISLVECAADRSLKANPLTVFGTLTKAPVATGSQLVAYSGFAAGTNYLEQVYSANLDFGTGDFCLPVWFYPTTANQTGTVWCRAPAVLAGNSFKIGLVNGIASFGRSVAGAAWAENTLGYTPPLNTWTLVNLVRVAGVIALRVNGVQQATTIADTNNYINLAAVFTVGVDNAHANPFLGSLALLRASATPASADQGAYRYETERKLFLPGAQCCIAGVSATVIGLDYDDASRITSIVTSWGVTEFFGLQAINSYATTIGIPTCISTRSGYKLLAGATGVSVYKPSRLLSEELARTAEQRKALGARLLKKTFVATAGQTDFDLGFAEVPVSVYQMGSLKDEGAGAGLYTLSDSGFRKTIKLATGATLNDRVTISYTQNL